MAVAATAASTRVAPLDGRGQIVVVVVILVVNLLTVVIVVVAVLTVAVDVHVDFGSIQRNVASIVGALFVGIVSCR